MSNRAGGLPELGGCFRLGPGKSSGRAQAVAGVSAGFRGLELPCLSAQNLARIRGGGRSLKMRVLPSLSKVGHHGSHRHFTVLWSSAFCETLDAMRMQWHL